MIQRVNLIISRPTTICIHNMDGNSKNPVYILMKGGILAGKNKLIIDSIKQGRKDAKH